MATETIQGQEPTDEGELSGHRTIRVSNESVGRRNHPEGISIQSEITGTEVVANGEIKNNIVNTEKESSSFNEGSFFYSFKSWRTK